MRPLQALIVLLGPFLGPFVVWLCALRCPADEPARFSREQIDFFEKNVRPLFVQRCFSCHGPKKQESGLRLDSRKAVLAGGDQGPAVELKHPETSLLLRAVRRQGVLKMPPKAPLPKSAVEALSKWVALGLPWPADASGGGQSSLPPPPTVAAARRSHWAFRPIRQAAVPRVKNAGWAHTPIDRFVLARLQQRGLAPSPLADRRTLIRRATFDLIGLPPTPAEVKAFLADASPNAFDRLVERLLASPHYGERWGRHWLDVARYADHKGYVFFEDKNLPWAYTYRDFVVDAFNDDLPYNRFVMMQLAADLVELGDDKQPLAALGFLTVGGRFMNNTHDIADDRIDVIARGLMGLTVTCARCHDHKYDPISQADYYSLYGVMRSSREPLVPPLFSRPPETEAYRKFAAELAKRQQTLREFVERTHAQVVRAARERAADYLLAAHAARGKPRTDQFMLLADQGDLNPSVIVRWRNYLDKVAKEDSPVWALWQAYGKLPKDQFTQRAPKVIAELADVKMNPLVQDAFVAGPPASLKEVAGRYGKLLNRVDGKWRELLRQAQSNGKPAPTRLSDPAEEQLRQVFYGEGAAGNVPKEFDWGFLSLLPDRPSQGEFKKLLGAVEKWTTSGPAAPPRAMVLADATEPFEPRVFLRGNPNRPGPRVPRRFVEVLAPSGHPFRQGSGRLELARAIVDPANPLTARVIVNRVWMHHFGRPLVATPSDFGLRSDPPSHPELLDYLAATFIERGWSLKDLHRRIMSSAVYQQASHDRAECLAADPENRLLWKMNRRRLEFEALRDSLLAVSGSLDSQIGGPPHKMFGATLVPRRTLYGYINRLDLPTLITTFDFPNPAASSPRRTRTTVPPQALYLMNHPHVAEAARRVVARLNPGRAENLGDTLREAYVLLFGRQPSRRELQAASGFLGPTSAKEDWERLVHGLMMTNEFVFID